MTTLSSRRLGHAARRRGAVAAGLAALAGLFVVATAAPAFAHHPEVTGETVCTNGNHVISWTIGNSETDKGMHIASAVATLGADTFATTGYSDVGPSGTTPATTVVPGSRTGTVTLTVDAIWTDGFEVTDSGSVTLLSTCAPTTTSTSTTIVTSTTQPTTSTTAPSTSTTLATTSTTVASTSTTQPTTSTTEGTTGSTVTTTPATIPTTTTVPDTPIVTEGSTVPSPTTAPWWHGSGTPSTTAPTGVAVAGSPSPSTGPGSGHGSLPFTGSSDVGPMIGMSSLMTGAVALLLARRKRRTL